MSKPVSAGLVNSAGEPFDPPAMVDDSRSVLTITRNETPVFFGPNKAKFFNNTVNDSDTVIGGINIAPRQARMMGISTSGCQWLDLDAVELLYFPVQYVIHLKEETWDFVLLDQGTYYWPDNIGPGEHVMGEEIAFTKQGGEPYVGLLDGSGHALPEGNADEFLTFRLYRQTDFSHLELPVSM